MRLDILAFLALLAIPEGSIAQNRPPPEKETSELYFLSIGIGEYQQTTQNAQPSLRSAELSARLVSEALIANGAEYGIQLTSRLIDGEAGHAVTRSDVTQAIIDLKNRMRRDGAVAPRVVIYVMGHGYGDPDLGLLFVQPGDVDISDRARSQLGVSGLIQDTVWNGDVLSAAVNFRTHPSMYYMDDFFPSQIMPNLTDPMSGLQTAIRANQLQAEEQRAKQEIGFPEEGNPPVPFVVLFDNCFDEIEQDIVVDAGMIGLFIQGLWDEIISDGLVFYAAQPGLSETDMPVPDWVSRNLGDRQMGPLGAMLLKVLDDKAFHDFGGFEREMNRGFDVASHPNWKPYSQGQSMSLDVSVAELLPSRGGIGELDVRFGGGG